MYPEKLEENPHRSWFGDDYLSSEIFAHCYIHENYIFKMHSHQFYEINIITKGEGRHYIADTYLPASVGDVFVIPPDVPHGYYTFDTLDIAHILLKKSFINRYREELLQIPGYDLFFDIEPFIRQTSGLNYNLNMGIEQLNKIFKKIQYIIDIENKSKHMYVNILVLSLISEISAAFHKKVRHLSNESCEDTELMNIMDFIKKNLDDKLSLHKIANYSNMSVATLNRRFNDILKISPMNYVINCRVQKAYELLEENKYSKTEIAQLCGFYDLSHLNKYLSMKCLRNEN